MMDGGGVHWADTIVIAVYFVLVMAVGLWTLCRPNRGNIKSYFLAGRSIRWWPVGASLFASNIGSEHFIGLAGTGAASGIAIVLYEFNSMPLVLALSWVFLPVYTAAGVFTLPEYLEKRFGGNRLRMYLSGLALVLYIVTKLAVSIYAGALFIQLALGWDMYLSIVIVLLVTGIFTVLGGLTAVIYTDAFQTVVMMLGALAMTIISFVRIGGYEQLKYKYSTAIPAVRANNTTCGVPRQDAFHLFRDPVTSDNPWPGLVLQSSIGCLWYWCADQVIVQRALAAKNLSHAKGGALLAGYLKLLPLFFMVFPGMISRALYPDEVACADKDICSKVCNNPVGCSNVAYPKLVIRLLPTGLRGLLLAVMMSAIMSSLTSIFNSASTLFTMDIWYKIRRRAGEKELLIVGRVAIVFLCGVSILWVPMVQSSAGGQLFVYIQAIQGYLGTPVGALFLIAIFWKRMNEKGAFWGILAGHTCGVIRMVLDFVHPAPQCDEQDTRPLVISRVHYTYFSQLNLVITTLVIVVVSLLTKAQDDEELCGVTWWTRKETPPVKDFPLSQTEETKEQQEPIAHGQDTEDVTLEVPVPNTETKPLWRRIVGLLCGTMEQTTDGPGESAADRLALLEEPPFWKRFLNVNAIIALTIMFFLWGFFY